MAAGKWFANSNSHADPHSHSYSHANPDSYSSSQRRRHVRSGLEFHPCLLQYRYHHLQWRKQSQQERLELYRAILEPGSGSNRCRQRGSGRLRRSVVYRRCLHHGHTDTDANSHSNSQSHSNSYSTAAGQRDLCRV